MECVKKCYKLGPSTDQLYGGLILVKHLVEPSGELLQVMIKLFEPKFSFEFVALKLDFTSRVTNFGDKSVSWSEQDLWWKK